MVDPVATESHVRGELPNDPDTDDIEFQLGEAAFENAQVNNVEAMDDAVRQRIEQKLAALKILEGPAREESQKSLGSGSKSYRGNVIARLRREINNLDPSGKLLDRNAANWTVTTESVTDD